MSKYTTGEIAKLCNVSVRTIQYYDTRGILVPSELSEGGRRLYNDDDLKKCRVICFLRDLDIPINSISQILVEPNNSAVIGLLLNRQKQILKTEIESNEQKLENIELLLKEVSSNSQVNFNSLGDIANIMENKNKLKKIRIKLFIMAVIMAVFEYGTLAVGIFTSIWWPFAVGMGITIILSIYLSYFYYKQINYHCPQCNKVFKPKFKEMFWAAHTPTTRKLTCPSCGVKGFCVETAADVEE